MPEETDIDLGGSRFGRGGATPEETDVDFGGAMFGRGYDRGD